MVTVSIPASPASPARGPDGARTEVLASGEGQQPWGQFHLATVMFLRAIQLRSGARPRVEVDGHKALRVAFLEVTAGAIPWNVR
jgi:RNA polymerase Rpb6